MKKFILLLFFFSVFSNSYAEEFPCGDFKKHLLWNNVDPYLVNPVKNGNFDEIVEEVNKRGKEIPNSTKIKMRQFEGSGFTFLYSLDLNSDNLEDFAVIIFDGRDNCGKVFLLKSNKALKNLILMPGIDSSSYENEGKLCKNLGQEMFFYKLSAIENYIVIRNFQGGNDVSFEIFRSDSNEIAKGICKVNMTIK